MNSRTPRSPIKLPTYTPPSISPIRPPSPLSEGPGSLADALIAPAGCELILRNPTPSQDVSTIKLVKNAIAKISMETPDLAMLPLDVIGTGSPSRDSNSYYCYARLSPDVAALDTSPRPDLLWQWKDPLLETLPGWDVTWAPQKRWKDRKAWVRLTSEHHIEEGDQEAFVGAVERTCKAAGYKITGSFFMKPASAGIVLSTTSEAERLVTASSIILECDTPMPLSTSPFRQIDIAWAFELIIGCVAAYDVTFLSYLDKWFASHYRDASGTSLLHTACLVEENFYCFVMLDWKATAMVLQDHETFASHFGPNLTPPRLLYQVNSDSSFNQRTTTASAIRSAGIDVAKDMAAMHKKIDQMQREMNMGFQHAEVSLNAVRNKVGALANTVGTVSALVHNNTLALMDQREERMKKDILGQLELSIIQTDMAVMRTSDPDERRRLSEKIKTLEAKHDTVAGECANMSLAIGNLIQNPPQATPTPLQMPGSLPKAVPPPSLPTPATSNPQLPETPDTSPAKRPVPPHMDTPTPLEKEEPAKKKKRSSASSRKSLEGERRLTRRATLTNLQVTSQLALEDDASDGLKDAFGTVKMVSIPDKNNRTDVNFETLPGPAERDVMQSFSNTSTVLCTDFKIYCLLNLVRRARMGQPKTKLCKNGILSPSLFLLTLCFLFLAQTASAMSFRASTLSVFALNANGLVHPGKIAHVNTAINSRRPHLFVISETKTNSRMGSKLPTRDYNIFEETGVKTDNHHLYKWGVIVGVRKDLQIAQRVSLSHPALLGRVIAVDFVLGTSQGRGFVHRFIGTYAPWNPGGSDNDFWGQVSNICLQSRHSWTLAGDVNATVSTLECASGGQDARRQYLHFLQNTGAQDLWMLQLDRSRDRDWTCRARGSSNGGNIIDRVVTSIKGLHDAEIGVAHRSTDYVPMTDHRGIFAYIQIEPPDGMRPSHVKSTHHDLSQYLGKPRLQYPSSSNKEKYSEFRIKVDEAIKAESIHSTPVIDDASFIRRYEAMTRILKQCGETVFGHVKRGGKLTHGKITSPKIQRIQAQIKNLGGALRMTNPNHMGAVSHASQQCFY